MIAATNPAPVYPRERRHFTAKEAKRVRKAKGRAAGVKQLYHIVLSNPLPGLPLPSFFSSFAFFASFVVTSHFTAKEAKRAKKAKGRAEWVNQLCEWIEALPRPVLSNPLLARTAFLFRVLRYLRCNKSFYREGSEASEESKRQSRIGKPAMRKDRSTSPPRSIEFSPGLS